MINRRALPFFCLALLGSPTLRAEAPVIRVSAAASLADVLQEINAAFEKSSGIRVELNVGASSMLARQIEEGAPVDVIFSADQAKMDGLEKQGLIDPTTREAQLSNTLVVVVPSDGRRAITSARDLAGVGKIALADPMSVPAGVYAKGWLEKLVLWGEVERKVVATEDVRAALAAVEAGNVDAGVVYKTDAAVSKSVKVAYEVPAAEVPPILYPMAVVKEAKNPTAARRYLDFLDGKEAHRAFEKFGFIVLPESPASAK